MKSGFVTATIHLSFLFEYSIIMTITHYEWEISWRHVSWSTIGLYLSDGVGELSLTVQYLSDGVGELNLTVQCTVKFNSPTPNTHKVLDAMISSTSCWSSASRLNATLEMLMNSARKLWPIELKVHSYQMRAPRWMAKSFHWPASNFRFNVTKTKSFFFWTNFKNGLSVRV